MLQEEPEMQELRLQIEGKHEGECKKPGETSKAGYRNITQFVCKRVCGRETNTHNNILL